MKKPKVIRFRCYCIECSDDDRSKDVALHATTAEFDRDAVKENEPNPHLAADSIEKVLFGA